MLLRSPHSVTLGPAHMCPVGKKEIAVLTWLRGLRAGQSGAGGGGGVGQTADMETRLVQGLRVSQSR